MKTDNINHRRTLLCNTDSNHSDKSMMLTQPFALNYQLCICLSRLKYFPFHDNFTDITTYFVHHNKEMKLYEMICYSSILEAILNSLATGFVDWWQWHYGEANREIRRVRLCALFEGIPNSKVHGVKMGQIWGRHDSGGSHVGPMNRVIWDNHC